MSFGKCVILCVLFSLVQHSVSEIQPCFFVSAIVSLLLLSRILLWICPNMFFLH